MNRLPAFLLTLGAAALAPAQNTLIVDDDGGAGIYTDIPPAVQAAVSGDVILVRPGVYSEFVVVGKALRVLAEPGALVVAAQGVAISVRNLPAGQQVVLRGLETAGTGPGEIEVLDNRGLVQLERITTTSPIYVQRCDQVALHLVDIEGAPPLAVVDSTLLAVQCRLSGRSGTAGLTVDRSRVTFAGGSIEGTFGGTLGPGIELVSGDVILGGADTVVQAGRGWSGTGSPTPAIDSVTGTVAADPAVRLVPAYGANEIAGGGSLTRLNVPSVRARLTGNRLDATVHGTPGQTSLLIASGPLSPSLPLPFGDLWVDYFHLVLATATIGNDGTSSASFTIPQQGQGTVAALQSVIVVGGQVLLSTPVLLTIDA